MRFRPVPVALAAAAVVALSGCSSSPASGDEPPAPAPVTVTETVEVEAPAPAEPRAVPESDPQLCASMRSLYTMNKNEGINQAYQGSYLDMMRANNCRMP